jgi:hypothetical protein
MVMARPLIVASTSDPATLIAKLGLRESPAPGSGIVDPSALANDVDLPDGGAGFDPHPAQMAKTREVVTVRRFKGFTPNRPEKAK